MTFRRAPPRARLSAAEPFPLKQAAAKVEPKSAGIYAIYENGKLQFVGSSRNVLSSLLSHDANVGGDDDDSFETRVKLLPGATGKQLQADWLEWIKEHGAVPPGNEKGNTRWTGAAAAAPAAQRAPPPPPPLVDVAERQNADADRLITASVWSALCTDGFVVIDNALPADAALAVSASSSSVASRRLHKSPFASSRTSRLLARARPTTEPTLEDLALASVSATSAQRL